jgi:predicted nucleic acid-binding protein
VIAYFDASALVKRHVEERGSRETLDFAARAEVVATSLISRAEVAAALAKAVRAKLLEEDEARKPGALLPRNGLTSPESLSRKRCYRAPRCWPGSMDSAVMMRSNLPRRSCFRSL